MSQNLEDIARLAGVSRSTVSRVINNDPNVSEKTRRKVLQVIRDNRFTPNIAARALVTQRTRILSVVIPQAVAAAFTDPYFPLLIQSISRRASEVDYAVMLWVGNDSEEENRFADRILSQSFSDGLIVTSVVDSDPLMDRLDESRFPYVLIGPPHRPGIAYVDVDNVGGACKAVEHLIALDRKRIGTITGPITMGAAQHRLKGYQLALEAAGRKVDVDLIFPGFFDEDSGYTGMKTLLKHGVDAVFTASDIMARGALRAALELGVRVPDDLAIIGFDDLDLSLLTIPPLTTVHQSVEGLGSTAVDFIVQIVNENPEVPPQRTLNTELIVRGSCGALSPQGKSGVRVRRHG
jgi:DNA-binding LacI/PurR family transcriptional regulator